MVQIKNKLKYFIIAVFLSLLASSASASVEVINTDFFRKISLGNLNLTLVDWDKNISQWVVDWQPLAGDIFELGLYPSNSLPSFILTSHDSWLFSLDQNNWQQLNNATIKAGKIFLKKDPNQNTLEPIDLKINLAPEFFTISEYLEYSLPENLNLISKVYKVDAQKSDFTAQFYYNIDSDSHKQIFQYDPAIGTWAKIEDGYNNVEDKFIKKSFTKITEPFYVAIFEDITAHDGIASFYDQSRYRSFGYKNGLYAASRHYPKGTKLKITRLLTGKSIIITVNDYGPESRTGRLVDLDKFAFKQIASLGAGLIYVKVEPL